MHASAHDAVFQESASRWTWPIAAAAAGSFYRYDSNLQPAALADHLRAVTRRLAWAGVPTCQFDAIGCPGGCTYTHKCGVAYGPPHG